MTVESYHVAIVGEGAWGKRLAVDLCRQGCRTALLERRGSFGLCAFRRRAACEMLAESARVAWQCRRAPDYGVYVGQAAVDFSRVCRRIREEAQRREQCLGGALERAEGLARIRGKVRFEDPHTLAVKTEEGVRQVTAAHIVLDLASHPRMAAEAFPQAGVQKEIDALWEEALLELPEVPERLVIVGHDPQALPLAQSFRRLGSQVTLIQLQQPWLAGEDEDLARAAEELLGREGVESYYPQKIESIRQAPDGETYLTLQTDRGRRLLSGSHLLWSSGRLVNVKSLGLNRAGIELNEQGHIAVDAGFRSQARHIRVWGDAAGQTLGSHLGEPSHADEPPGLPLVETGTDISASGEALAGLGFSAGLSLPTHPPLLRLGMTEQQARQAGLKARSVDVSPRWRREDAVLDERPQWAKLVIDAESERICGAAALCDQAEKFAAAVKLAVATGAPWRLLRDL